MVRGRLWGKLFGGYAWRNWKYGLFFVDLRSPVDSRRLAVLTVSPNRQYRGIVRPTTPAAQEPAKRIRMNTNSLELMDGTIGYILVQVQDKPGTNEWTPRSINLGLSANTRIFWNGPVCFKERDVFVPLLVFAVFACLGGGLLLGLLIRF